MTSTATDSPLVAHARRELTLAGLLGKDSDYDGMLGEAALQIVETFATQGHSGMSAFATVDIAQRLMSYEPLTPLTNDPAEWNHIADDMAGRPDLWQSARKPDAFSNDGGLTYKVTDSGVVHTSAPAKVSA